MVEFLIFDENPTINKMLIDKVMMNYDYEYKTTILKLSSNWQDKITKENFKIFLINTDIKNNLGLNLAKYLRIDLCDWQSMMIFKTTSNNLKYEIINHRFMYIDYLLTTDTSYEKKLETAFNIALKNYDSRPNTLKYIYKNTIYNISFSNIIYIEKEKESKKCIIKTKEEEFEYSGNMKILEEKLDRRFIKCSRSYIINMDQVEYYNTKENIIIFRNKESINFISRNKKKELISYLRDI